VSAGERVGAVVGPVVDKAREVTDHPALRQVARMGLIAYGLMHLLIAVLATRLAWGARGADADQTGALRTVGDWIGGPMVLWAIGLGLLALAVWQGGEVLLWWHGLLDGEHRLRAAYVCAKCLAKAGVYALLGVTALLFALGLDYEADERVQELTLDTLGIPGGAVLVAVVATGVCAVGLYVLSRGLTGGFMKDIDLPAAPDRWEPVIEVIGRVGYLAKGVAFTLVGVLGWRAATSADVEGATGLEGAMTAVLSVTAGPWLLTAVAVGFGAFGVYALARARYPDRDPSSRAFSRESSGPRAAGDVDHLAGDEAGSLAGQERHGVRDVLRLPGAAHRDRRGPLLHVLVPVRADPLGGRAGHVGDDEARRHRVGRDAVPAQLDREGLREALQPGLGGGVVGLPAVAQRRGARQVHDPAPAGLDHVRLDGAGDQERAAQVHRHDGVPVGVAHLEQQVVAGDAGVVHQHGRRAERVGDLRDGGLHRVGVADVRADGEAAPARRLDRLHRVGAVAGGQVDDGDVHAVGGQPRGRGGADAPGRAGDDGDPAHGTRSKTAARPWPPPMHIVSRP
jgi:hypothetical protein